MVEHFSNHFSGVYLISFMVLHMRVPHEICHFIRHNNFLPFFASNIEKLHIMFVGIVEIKVLEWKIFGKIVVTSTGLLQPLCRTFFICVEIWM